MIWWSVFVGSEDRPRYRVPAPSEEAAIRSASRLVNGRVAVKLEGVLDGDSAPGEVLESPALLEAAAWRRAK